MIDLTPLDVRKKRGDFRKGLRGYETQEVDTFLDLVAERLEVLVRENLQLRERAEGLEEQVKRQTDREEAVRDALVTAQGLRAEIQEQAKAEAEKVVEEARTEARRMLAEAEAEVRVRLRHAERRADQAEDVLAQLDRRRLRFLKSFRQLLEREMDVVEVEESRPGFDERPIDLDFRQGPAAEDGPDAVSREAVPIEDLGPHYGVGEGEGEGDSDSGSGLDPGAASDDFSQDGVETDPDGAGASPSGTRTGADQEPLPQNLLLYLDEDEESEKA